MFQHDATHSGAADCSGLTQENVETLHPAWFVKTAGAVTDEPVVADGLVFAGDSTGVFTAVNQVSGTVAWTFNVTSNTIHDDQHSVSFGEIPGSAAVAQIGSGDPTIFVGGGGTLYALDAVTGKPIWAQDADPGDPTSAVEVESSPVVDTATTPPEVILGDDTNESTGIAMTGLMAFNAVTGALIWKYEPEDNVVITPAQYGGSTDAALSAGDNSSTDDACGDVWSSPALDTSAGPTTNDEPDGRVFFATGDCPTTANDTNQVTDVESVFAVDALTGQEAWNFPEPPNSYTNANNEGLDADDDFGASPIITSATNPATGHPIVVEAGKSGFVYGLDELTGKEVWQTQAAEPGQLTPQAVGAIGGFIGSPALGEAAGQAAIFLTSAVFTPLTGPGVDLSAPPYPQCSVAGESLGQASPPACPDTGLVGTPTSPLRLASVHAVDAETGAIIWQEPLSSPTYAPATYANGVVFAPSTTGFSADAYDADNGVPLWTFPLAASGASGVAIEGGNVYLGAGISEQGQTFTPVPGIWSFTLGTGVPPIVSNEVGGLGGS